MTLHDIATFDLDAYLRRIGLQQPPACDIEGLNDLLLAHRSHIPFENLDIPLGRTIDLAPAIVFDKLVTRRRGGYCFEHNQLFRRALQAIGFDARQVLARVWLRTDGVPPPTHTLVIVNVGEEEWLADAGFGGSYVPPLRLTPYRFAQGADGSAHRLDRDAFGFLLRRRAAGSVEWVDQYSFTPETAQPMDLEMANHWTATRPHTRFTTHRIVSMVRPEGFVSLVDRVLGATGDGYRQELDTVAAYRELLATLFGIDLTPDEVAALDLFDTAQP